MDLNKVKSQFSTWRGQYERWLPREKSAKILDLGCGHGGMVYWLQSAGYVNTEGIDVNRESIDTGLNLGIKNLHHGDAVSFLRDKANSYDVVFLVDVLGFLMREEVLEVLRVAVGALKPGGRVVVRSANAESPMAGRILHGHLKEDAHFTENSLKEVLRKSGVKSVGAYPVRPVVHGIKSFIRYCFWLVIEVFLKFYRLVEAGTARGIFTQNMIVVGVK